MATRLPTGELPELRTERLVLRPATAIDADSLHRIWTDEAVRRYLFDDEVISPGKAAAIIADCEKSGRECAIGLWTIRPAETERDCIGFCGFLPLEGSDVELIYGLLPEWQGKGLATEASRAALKFLWSATEHPRVWARTDAPNVRSLDLMRRLGMQEAETQRGPAGQPLVTFVLCRPRSVG